MSHTQPTTIESSILYTSKELYLGMIVLCNGVPYSVEIIGAEAISFGDYTNPIPNRKRAIVCAKDKNKTVYNLIIKG